MLFEWVFCSHKSCFAVGDTLFEVVFCPRFDTAPITVRSATWKRKLLKCLQEHIKKLIILNKHKNDSTHLSRNFLWSDCLRVGFWCQHTWLDFGFLIDPINQPIKSDSLSSRHMSHCWTSSFNYHLDHSFTVLVQLRLSLRRKCVLCAHKSTSLNWWTSCQFLGCWYVWVGRCCRQCDLVLLCHSFFGHHSCLSVTARFKIVLFFFTFDTASLWREEQEDETETRCITSEWKEAATSTGPNEHHSSEFHRRRHQQRARIQVCFPSPIFLCVLWKTAATVVNMNVLGVCVPPKGLDRDRARNRHVHGFVVFFCKFVCLDFPMFDLTVLVPRTTTCTIAPHTNIVFAIQFSAQHFFFLQSNCAFGVSLVVVSSSSTDPIHAWHNGQQTSLQVLPFLVRFLPEVNDSSDENTNSGINVVSNAAENM